jgi:hypothetical protein
MVIVPRLDGAPMRGKRDSCGLLSADSSCAPEVGRNAARLDRQRITRSEIPRGILELVFDIGRGVSDICAASRLCGDEMCSANGCRPVISS